MATINDAKKITAYIVKTIDPVCVVIFSSVAKVGKGKDIDLLIVTEDRERELRKLNFKVNEALRPFYEDVAIEPFIVPRLLLREYFLKGSPF